MLAKSNIIIGWEKTANLSETLRFQTFQGEPQVYKSMKRVKGSVVFVYAETTDCFVRFSHKAGVLCSSAEDIIDFHVVDGFLRTCLERDCGDVLSSFSAYSVIL